MSKLSTTTLMSLISCSEAEEALILNKLKIPSSIGGEITLIPEFSVIESGPHSRVWACGIVLARWAAVTDELRDRCCSIELGCGAAAAPSRVCSKRYGDKMLIVATDCIFTSLPGDAKKIRFMQFNWENPPKNNQTHEFEQIVDTIFGSDVVYSLAGAKSFIKAVEWIETRSSKRVIVYMTHKHRHDVVDKTLVEGLEECGWSGEEIDLKEVKGMQGYLYPRISLWKLQKRAKEFV